MHLRRSLFLGLLSAVVGLAAIGDVQAQPQRGGNPVEPPKAEPPVTLTAHPLTPEVYWVEDGAGLTVFGRPSNAGFIVGNKGVIVIDTTGSLEGGRKLQSEVAKVTSKPITTVILTHGDSDHIGGLSTFPTGITIVAQQNCKQRMEAEVAAGSSYITADRLPNHTVDKREDLEIEGVMFELLHWAPAHTAGDLVIYLPMQKIVFTGDLIVLDQPRVALIHREQQGTSEGWIESAKGILALDADRYVVGHSGVQNKQEIEQRVNLVITERNKIRELVAKGETLQQIQAEVSDIPQKPAPNGPHFTSFSEVVYRELTEKR